MKQTKESIELATRFPYIWLTSGKAYHATKAFQLEEGVFEVSIPRCNINCFVFMRVNSSGEPIGEEKTKLRIGSVPPSKLKPCGMCILMNSKY